MPDSSIAPLVERASRLYRTRFGASPTAASAAPGRVEVLGNHTDYNGGYILSAALNMYTVVLGHANPTDVIDVAVLTGDQSAVTAVYSIAHQHRESWANYLYGVVDQIAKLPSAPTMSGMTLGLIGEVPLGAGLSSSAALEVATALTVQQLVPFELDKMGIALLCQRAENQFVGVQSGLMDQFSSVFGKADSFLFLDCRTFDHAEILSPTPFELVICDSMVKHELTGGEYNSRREECESAAAKLDAAQLRDLTPQQVESGKAKLTENEYKRALHITTENERVLRAREAVAEGNLKLLGILMNASHNSSQHLFENSTVELDALAEIARAIDGCYGARLTGGGFGGAIIALIEHGKGPAFADEIKSIYGAIIGTEPNVYISRVGDGAMVVDLDPLTV